MRISALISLLVFVICARGADVERRVLTHYVPQDFLEATVRTEGWVPLPLDVKGGSKKDDVIRIWAGGSIDHGGGDRPGQYVHGPSGIDVLSAELAVVEKGWALAEGRELSFALLFKTEKPGVHKCAIPGKPLEIKLTKDNEKVWIGYNDGKGAYKDNHLGRGERHEIDPAWVRIELVRTVVD